MQKLSAIFCEQFLSTCPKTGRLIGIKFNSVINILLFPIVGLAALLWILFRVIPKPSRITYPCIKVATPIASSFLIYIMSFFASVFAFKRARRFFLRAKPWFGVSLLTIALLSGTIALITNPDKTFANVNMLDDPLGANHPIGEAKGIFPGRVVWAWNPDATNENCTNESNDNSQIDDSDDGWFLPRNNNQSAIDNMLSDGIQELTGTTSNTDAWDAIFKFHNNTRDKGEVAYQPGEIIFIKINATSAWLGNYSTPDFSIVDNSYYGVAETNPHLILSVLRQLVNVVGVDQTDIYVGDPSKAIYKHSYNLMHSEFPDVVYLDHNFGADNNRTKVTYTTDPVIEYSDRGTVMHEGTWDDPFYGPPTDNDRLATILQDCEYLINLPTMKGHKRAGITLFAKNHFGSNGRSDASHLHSGLVNPSENDACRQGYGIYRVQVDLMGHEMTGKKNLIFILDALYSGPEASYPPTKWEMAPFNGDWTSSLFVSLDPVAIESVAYDFLRTEYTESTPYSWVQMSGVDDYLHQAADSDYWPDGIQYDPEEDGTIIGSLGVHEHWNNTEDKNYTRNLDTGIGIELVKITSVSKVDEKAVAELPGHFQLLGNYPNPFNPETTIRYSLDQQAHVMLTVYDIQGHSLQTLTDEYQHRGYHIVTWNGLMSNNATAAAGIYFYQFKITGSDWESSKTGHMMLIK
jgi:hypothetical protein